MFGVQLRHTNAHTEEIKKCLLAHIHCLQFNLCNLISIIDVRKEMIHWNCMSFSKFCQNCLTVSGVYLPTRIIPTWCFVYTRMSLSTWKQCQHSQYFSVCLCYLMSLCATKVALNYQGIIITYCLPECYTWHSKAIFVASRAAELLTTPCTSAAALVYLPVYPSNICGRNYIIM